MQGIFCFMLFGVGVFWKGKELLEGKELLKGNCKRGIAKEGLIESLHRELYSQALEKLS
jgi:hypothetical protein